jgi:hypothetical protein
MEHHLACPLYSKEQTLIEKRLDIPGKPRFETSLSYLKFCSFLYYISSELIKVTRLWLALGYQFPPSHGAVFTLCTHSRLPSSTTLLCTENCSRGTLQPTCSSFSIPFDLLLPPPLVLLLLPPHLLALPDHIACAAPALFCNRQLLSFWCPRLAHVRGGIGWRRGRVCGCLL